MAFPTDWDLTYYVTVTSKPTYVNSTQTDYISLIDEQQVNSTFWANVQNGGGSIAICTSPDGSGQVPIEVSVCNTATSKLSVFLKRTITFGGGDKIYVFYKASVPVTQPAVGDTYGRNAVWSHKNFKGVWHLEESATPGSVTAAGFYVDSSGTGNDGQGNFAPTQVDAIIQKGQQGNGTNRRIIIGDTGFPTGTATCTMAAWMNLTGDTSEQTPIGYGTDADGRRRVLQQRDDGIGMHFSDSFRGQVARESGLTYLVGIIPSGATSTSDVIIYINGALISSVNLGGTTPKTLNTQLNMSQILRGTGGAFASDPIDECRICLDVLPADWIRINYYNQLDTTNLWSTQTQVERNFKRGVKRGHLRGTAHG